MNKNLKLGILIGSMVLLFVGATVLYNSLRSGTEADQLVTLAPSQQPETDPSETLLQEQTDPPAQEETQAVATAPDFTVLDRQGKAVKLSDYFGKPIVLNFWASWCDPCKMEMPDFQEQYEALGENVHFLMVNMTTGRETVDSATALVEEKGYTFPVFFDTQAEAATVYGVYSLPTTYFIDAQGVPIAQATGALDAATLQKGIDMIYTP